jgi:hypothetical protein
MTIEKFSSANWLFISDVYFKKKIKENISKHQLEEKKSDQIYPFYIVAAFINID